MNTKSEIDILANLLNKNELKKFYFLVKNYIKNKTDNPIINNLIGIYFHKKSEFTKALRFFDYSLSKSDVYAVYLNKCSSLMSLKRYDEALQNYNYLIEKKPNVSIAYIGVSNIYLTLEKFSKAENVLKLGLVKLKKDFEINYALANCYFIQRKYLNALEYYNYSIEIKNNHPDLYNRKGLCLEALNRDQESKQCYLQAIKLTPNHIDALCNLANLERSLGNMIVAKSIYLKVLKFDPFIHQVHRYLSVINKYSCNDQHLNEMLNIIKTEKFKKNPEKYYEILFALAKAFEDFGEYEKSIKYLFQGNQLRRQTTVKHSIDYAKKHFKTIKNIFSKINLSEIRGSENKSMIFVVGMPRSGTTLVEQILASHHEVYSGGEMTFVSEVIKSFYPEKNLKKFSESVLQNIKKNISFMASKYLTLVSFKNKKKYLTDKLPNNFMFIGFIKLMFPNSKIVVCKRNAKDNCLSIFKNFFSDNGIWFAYDQKELNQYYHVYKDYLKMWKDLFPNQIVEVDYELLISDQEKYSKKLLNDLGLSWDENCLKFYQNKTKVETLSTSQVRKPIYSDSVNKFKYYENYLVDLFENL